MNALIASEPDRALSRIIALALWIESRVEGFAFEDVRAAFRDTYQGSAASVDRMWSRDKQHLSEIGYRLAFDGERYALDQATFAKPPYSGDAASALEAAAAALRMEPAQSIATALPKLALLGVPVLPILRERLEHGLPRTLAALVRRVVGAYVLLNLVPAAGELGLTLEDALTASGLASERELATVVATLESLQVPLPAPADESGITVEDGRLVSYMWCRPLRRLALTADEQRALHAALAA